ncbi:MAG: glycoside hydrolase family 1 protein [Armatimonadetes bacterium]|nr:glycoside hydrolase family 1 protein [Armatimonadota bacterium]
MITLGAMSVPEHSPLQFPPDFRWGTATSAHQVEGDNLHNDWWAWEQQPGRIKNGDRSGRACDWWDHAERDFDLAAKLHQNAHRLSVEWSRIQPAPDRWDEEAIGRYREMLYALRQRGIQPMVTLHHFTNPLWFADRGGWERDDAAMLFARFVERVVPPLAEFADLWCTLNEPVGWAFSAYVSGIWPPGGRSIRRGLGALTQLLQGHAAAYRIVHRLQPQAQVGFANYFRLFDPANAASPFDRIVARQQDRFVNRAFIDGTAIGRVRAFPWVANVPEAAGTMDFVGVNYYTRDLVAFDLHRPKHLFGRNFTAPGAPISDGEYGEIYPEGLYRVLQMAAEYRKPIFITENGLPDEDDDRRSDFIVSHLRQVWRAIHEGIPVRGYYHWSLVDNFEWAAGWSLKFGLIEVDPATQTRTPRPSASVYAEICGGGTVSFARLERFAR